MQGNETTLMTLGVADIKYSNLEIYIGSGQCQRFGDTQSGCRQ